MKKLLLAALLVGGIVSAAQAVPYAGQIRVSSLIVAQGVGLTINYQLNEAADSVSIEVRNLSNVVVATFAGTAVQGANSVAWNGTANNAAGPAVTAGNYRVRITANKNAPIAWTEFASNRSVGNFGTATILNTIFNGYSGRSWVITRNTDSPAFGYALGITSYLTVPPHAAAVVFDSDLSISAGDDGFASRKLKGFGDGVAITNNTAFWDAAIDPDDPTRVWATGQGGIGPETTATGLMTASPILSDNLVDADPFDRAGGILPRGLDVRTIGGIKYAFLTGGSGIINRVVIDGTNTVTNVAAVDILGVSAVYSRDVRFDAAGNLYYTTRDVAGGNIYRWDAALVASAVADSLTPSNASWTITGTATAANMMGVAIGPDGSVYTLSVTGTDRGIYLVGNTSAPTLTKTLALADRVVDYVAIPWQPSTAGGRIAVDIAGNVYATDNSVEQARAFGPGGNTSQIVVAPSSETFTVTAANVSGWDLY